nr:MAG: triosephosphate isomerase [actinobacterium acMicro-1]
MAVDRLPLIAGNWKMNLDHLQAIAFTQKLAWTLRDARHDYASTEVALFPPFTDLRSIQNLIEGDKFDLAYGGQDLSAHDAGAYTGEVSGGFLRSLGSTYVLVGHSERRQYHGETDDMVRAKVSAALRNDLTPIICVGETEADLAQYGPSAVPVTQLSAALNGVSPAEIVIAYEPVWAIGTGKAASEEQAQQVSAALRATVTEVWGLDSGDATRILYGGSVRASNISALMRQPDVDGALVGGASLDVTEFSSICRFLKHVV